MAILESGSGVFASRLFRGVVLFLVCLFREDVTVKGNLGVSVNVMVHPE